MKEAVLVCAVFVGAVTPANAGPDWVEGLDAGGTPGSATNIIGMGPLFTISGSLSQAFGPGVADFEDMFIIRITDALRFSASSDDPSTIFDVQMFLFRFDTADPMMDGLGLLANRDTAMGNDVSMLGPISTDGTIVITEGIYYLAISGGAGEGAADPGRYPIDGGSVPVFALADLLGTPFDILSPDPAAGAIAAWAGEGGVGSYVIHLEGVSFVPAPGAAGVLALGLLAIRRRRRV